MPSTLPRVGPDIGPILSLVRKTRLVLRGSWGTIGVGLTLGLAFAALALVTAVDMLVPLVAPWVRLVGLILFVVPTLVVFVWKGVLPLSRRLRNVEVARRIESHIPGMHSRLVSCMDLAGREGEVSQAFYRKLVNESLDRIGKYRSTSVVDFRAIWRSLRFALLGIGVFALLWLGLGSKLTTALARVFNPFADLPPTSDVAYTIEPGTTKVLTGEDVNFAATMMKGEPESLTLELVGNDATVRHPLKKESDGVWRLTLRGLSSEKGFEKGFTYRVFGGRTWTKENRIDWTQRPVIVDTQVKLHYPDYMAIPDPRPNPPRERDVIGPAGSRVEVAVEVEGDVARGQIELLKPHVKYAPSGNRPGQTWVDIAIAMLMAKHEDLVVDSYPLQPAGDRIWIGSFPLSGSGRYRIVLWNQLGHANKPASGHPKYEAIADHPPFVQIDRPGDLILSKPDKVPVTIGARDDHGLLDLWIATQKVGELKYTRSVRVKEYSTPNPLKADALVTMLDLTATGFNLKPGVALRYRVEVRDRRPNSEPVVSKDFTIRITEDPNAADKLLEAFEKGQDTFRDKLLNLIAEQRKVQEKIDQVQAKYDALNTKVQSAIEEARAKAKPNDGQLPKEITPPPIDPKDAAEMAALRKDLAELFDLEQKNVAAASALDQELKNLAAQAQKNSLLDGAINKEMQNLAGQFKNAALDPLQDLASKLQQGTNSAQLSPDLKGVKNLSDRVQKNLESLKSRMDALADAQKDLKSDVEKALAKLKDELLKEQGKMTAQDLAELKEFLKNLREELAKMQGKQEDLADKTEKAPDKELTDIEQKQLTLDELLKKDLDLAKKILDREKTHRMMRKPEFPDEPFAGDPKERNTAPREDDTSESDAKKKSDNATNPTGKLPPIKKDGMDDEEDLFKPRLKGDREKLDLRFAKKIRPTPKKDGKNDSAEKRDALRDHQHDNLRDLDAAQKGLKSDEQTLEEMIKSLANASQRSNQDQPTDSSGKSQMDQLMQMLRSEAMRNAMQMAQRARQSGKGQPQQGTPQSPPSGLSADSLSGNSVGLAGVLDELDPRTRATILQLPARVREELLQGMKNQGPEGYQKFIQDYFRRLADVPK